MAPRRGPRASEYGMANRRACGGMALLLRASIQSKGPSPPSHHCSGRARWGRYGGFGSQICHLAGRLVACVGNNMKGEARLMGEKMDAFVHIARSRAEVPGIDRSIAKTDLDRELRPADERRRCSTGGEFRFRCVFDAQR